MSPEQTIAHYRIASKLGEGGMAMFTLWLDRRRLEESQAVPRSPVLGDYSREHGNDRSSTFPAN